MFIRILFSILFFVVTVSQTSAQETWQSLTYKADSLENISNYKSALEFRELAVQVASTQQKDSISFLKLLKTVNEKQLAIKDNPKDEEAYKNLKTLVEQLANQNAKPKRLYSLNKQLFYIAKNNMRNLKDSDAFITKALKYQLESETIDSVLLIKNRIDAGAIYRQSGKLKASLNSLQKAETTYLQSNMSDNELLSKVYLNISQIYGSRYLYNPTNYLKYVKKAQALLENIENPDITGLFNIYLSLSTFETTQGNFDESVNYLKKTVEVYEKSVAQTLSDEKTKRDITREIQLHAYLIEVYWLKSDELNMLNHFNQLVELTKDKRLSEVEEDLVSLSYQFVAKYYRNKDGNKALDYLNKGLKMIPKNDYYNAREEFAIEKAKILLGQKKYELAEPILLEITQNEDLPLFMKKNSLEQIILLYAALDEIDKAYDYTNQFLKLISKENTNLDIETLNVNTFTTSYSIRDANHFIFIAKGLQKADNADSKIVETLYWLALKQFENNFTQEYLNNKIEKIYDAISDYFYDKAAKKELDERKLNVFIQFTEAVESKYLLNKFINNRNFSNRTELDSLVHQEQLIRSNITYLKKQNSRKKSDSIKQLIFEENLKLDKIDEKLNASNNNATSALYAKYSLDNLKDQYVIKFNVIDSTLYRTVFDTGIISVKKFEDYPALKEKIHQTISQLKDINISTDVIKENASYLFDQLFADIDLSKTLTNITIIPDDVLYYLPFELLVNDDNYLLRTKTISYVSSVSFLGNNFHKNDYERDIVLFAPSYKTFAPSATQLAIRGEPYYLEGTIKEVESISKLFNKSDLYINERASKSSFENLSNDYAILHLSMHSFLNDQDSELSSLVFTDGNNDYELYISELYGLNLNADLAVLSACNTGVGTIATGKGMVSMNNAFTTAGVPAVLSSLWSAPDQATKEIMINFYGNLKTGQTKNVALKNAKLDYLKNTDDVNLKHPYYWAGFVITGDTSSIASSEGYWSYIYVIIGLISLVLLILIVKTKRLKTN